MRDHVSLMHLQCRLLRTVLTCGPDGDLVSYSQQEFTPVESLHGGSGEGRPTSESSAEIQKSSFPCPGLWKHQDVKAV